MWLLLEVAFIAVEATERVALPRSNASSTPLVSSTGWLTRPGTVMRPLEPCLMSSFAAFASMSFFDGGGANKQRTCFNWVEFDW